MGEDIKQIEREIVAARHQLGRNVNELQAKAQEFRDWRTHYRNHPRVLLGMALTGGLLIGAMARRGRSAGHAAAPVTMARPRSRASRQLGDTWLSVSDALLGVASAKVMALVSSVVPGFGEQVSRAQARSDSDPRGTTR